MQTFPYLSEKPNAHGRYVIRWTEVVGGEVRAYTKSTRTADRKAAEAALAKFLTETRHKRQEPSLTVSEAAESYLEHYALPRDIWDTESKSLRSPLRRFGHVPVAALQDSDVEAYAKDRMTGEKPVKAMTVRREIDSLQAALNWCSRKGMIPGKPIFRFPRPEADATVRDRWLTEDQERQIISLLPKAPDNVRLFFRLAITYGARLGAIMDLKAGPQIDFDACVIDFNAPGKRITRKRRPKAPMTLVVRNELMKACADLNPGDRLFPYTTPDDFTAWMKEIGFGWVTPHVLKHSAITLMLRGGARIDDVAAVTNTDPQTIHRVYRHHSADEMLAVLERRRA